MIACLRLPADLGEDREPCRILLHLAVAAVSDAGTTEQMAWEGLVLGPMFLDDCVACFYLSGQHTHNVTLGQDPACSPDQVSARCLWGPEPSQ